MLSYLNIFGSLASIIGLVFSYRSEKQKAEDATFEGFLMSLDSKRHKALIDEINSNHLLAQGIKLLLRDNHEELGAKLEIIDNSISAVSTEIAGLREISEALNANRNLSKQAISILVQLCESGGSTILERQGNRGKSYQILGVQRTIKISEPKYLEDDFGQLCKYDLLIPDTSTNGRRLFRITRAADQLVAVSDL